MATIDENSPLLAQTHRAGTNDNSVYVPTAPEEETTGGPQQPGT